MIVLLNKNTAQLRRAVGKKPNHQRGHSLIEVMIALPLLTAIIFAAGGLIAVASKSRTLSEGLIADQIEALQTSQHFLSDLPFAASIANVEKNSIEFSVSDRTGDRIPDAIRYEWSGVVGDPLHYSINNSLPVVVAEDVREFSLNNSIREITSTAILKHHDDAFDGEFHSKAIAKNDPASQFISIDLPKSATLWSLERVRFMARSSGIVDGEIAVSIVGVDGSQQPASDKIYETQIINEHELDSDFGWVDVKFWNVDHLSEQFAIVFSYKTGTDAAADVLFEADGLNMTSDTAWMTSKDNGQTWTIPNAKQDLRFYAIGSHNGLMESRRVINQVRMSLKLGASNYAFSSTVRLLNEPEVVVGATLSGGNSNQPEEATSSGDFPVIGGQF